MDSFVWLQRRNVVYVRVCHHISDAVYFGTDFFSQWQFEALVTAWLLRGYCLVTAYLVNGYFLVTIWLLAGYCYCLVASRLLPSYCLVSA